MVSRSRMRWWVRLLLVLTAGLIPQAYVSCDDGRAWFSLPGWVYPYYDTVIYDTIVYDPYPVYYDEYYVDYWYW